MHHGGLEALSKNKPSLEDLMGELNSIERDVVTIQCLKISDEAKKLPLEELQQQLNDVKEKMHECIDEL